MSAVGEKEPSRTHPLLGPLEMTGANGGGLVAGCFDGGLVDERLKVGSCSSKMNVSDRREIPVTSATSRAPSFQLTREANRAASDGRDVDLQLVVANVAHVMLENLHAATNVGKRYNDVTIETTGTDEGLVERFGEVGSCW